MWEQAPVNGVSQAMLIPVYGESSFTTAGPGGASRGATAMAGLYYAVYEQGFYRVDSDGTANLLGTVAGTEAVKFANNGVQIIIVADAKSYVYSTNGDTFAQITDANFLEASDVAFLDGYFIFAQKDTNQFFWSPLYDDLTGESDLTAFDATDRARALASTGNITALVADYRELWIFKSDAFTEVWQGISDPNLPFAQLSNAYMARGCFNKYSVQKLDNTLFWFGDDRIVYRAEGYLPKRISHHGIERQIATLSSISDMFTVQWEEAGHKLFGLWFPTGGLTIVYDAATGVWHTRESNGFGFWRVNSVVACYGTLLITDSDDSRIGKLERGVFTEYGNAKPAYIVGPTMHAEGALFSIDRMEVLCETGLGGESGDEPKVTLSISPDFGRTYNTPKTRSLGKRGEYSKRCVWRQLGTYRQATPKLRFTSPVRRYVLDAYAELSPRRV
jgi:hypothetical protein